MTLAKSWWEIQILCDPLLEESIFWRLGDFGCRGTSSQYKGNSCLIGAYLPRERVQLLDLAALSLWLRQDSLVLNLAAPAMQWHLIDEEDWASSWKQYWHPQEIGDRFLIYPAWLPLPKKGKGSQSEAVSDRLLLRLDPGAAFGTGQHQTTQLCLEALEMRLSLKIADITVVEETETGETILADIGCGSGILSIGAMLLGATRTYSLDIDPLAVRAACANRDLNRISDRDLIVCQGSMEQLLELTDEPVDGLMCNILAEVIIDLIPQWDAIVKPTTWGIISGLLLDQAKPIADVLEQHGWLVATLWRRGEWCCLNIRRSQD